MRPHHVLLAAALVGACGTDDPTNDVLDPPPPEGGQQLATESFRLAPGAEKYMCYQFYSPEDAAVGITRIDSISAPGVHHVGLFQAFGRNEPDAPHECETLIKQTWLPIWATGTGSPFLELPAGTAFVIQPATQYIVQLHLQNSTDEEMTIRTGLNLTYDRNTSALQPAGMFAFGTFEMEIPPNTTDYQVPVSGCTTGRPMNVFAAFPHMHKYGTKLTMTRSIGGAPASMLYQIDPWTFGDQPMDPLEATVGPDDTFNLTCHYDNPTANAIPYGESSDTEMCFFVLFYYPYTGIGGCVTGA